MRVFSFAHLSVLALAINLAACGDSEPTTSATAVTPAPAAAKKHSALRRLALRLAAPWL